MRPSICIDGVTWYSGDYGLDANDHPVLLRVSATGLGGALVWEWYVFESECGYTVGEPTGDLVRPFRKARIVPFDECEV